jgi:hypothetical protein
LPKFFDFFNRKEPEIEIKVELSKLEDWLKAQVDEDFKIIYEEGNSILEQIRQSCSNVKRNAEEFSKAEIKTGELNEHLIPTIRNSRSSIAFKTINSVSKLDFPKITDFSTLVGVSQNFSQTLAQIDQTLKTHGRVIFTILSKEIRPLVSELKVIQREAAELSKLAEINSSKANNIQKLFSSIYHILDLKRDDIKLTNSVIDDKSNYDNLQSDKLETEKLLKNISKSEDYRKSIKKMEEQKELSIHLIRLKAEFDTSFSKLRKPLEKYSYIAKINKNEERILEQYIESPSFGLISDNKLILKKFLNEIVSLVKNRKLSIKTPDKVLYRIEEILPKLQEIRNDIARSSEDYEKSNATLKNSSINKVEKIKKDLSQKVILIQNVNSSINKKNVEIDNNRKKSRELVIELEKEIEETLEKKIEIIGIDSENIK